jgi:hypothetical protein
LLWLKNRSLKPKPAKHAVSTVGQKQKASRVSGRVGCMGARILAVRLWRSPSLQLARVCFKLPIRRKTPEEALAVNRQVAYNAGRDMKLKGWAKVCPYKAGHIFARCWWRGWYDAEKTLANQ